MKSGDDNGLRQTQIVIGGIQLGWGFQGLKLRKRILCLQGGCWRRWLQMEAKQHIASIMWSVKEYTTMTEGDEWCIGMKVAKEELLSWFHHAAAIQSALIKKRREVTEQQLGTMLDWCPKHSNQPMGRPNAWARYGAQEVRGVGLSAYHKSIQN